MNYLKAISLTKNFVLFLCVCYLDVSYQTPQETQCIRRQGWSNVAGYLTESAVDRFQCIRQCLRQQQCRAIKFTDGDKACTYYLWDQLKLTKSSAANALTFVREVKAVAVQDTRLYQYDFNTASNVCTSFGGQLTEYTDLQNAWQSGLSYCKCGWLSNGWKYYPSREVNNPGCTYGLISCGDFPAANAWCSI